MKGIGDIKRLKTSWTKYDTVQVIEIVGDNKLQIYLHSPGIINIPVLHSYLGINSQNITIPHYWEKIQKYPKQKKLFTLAAGIFTHHENISMFAGEFSEKNMQGTFNIGFGGKHKTNLRSALVVSGAAKNSDRRASRVHYDLSELFAEVDIGIYFKELLIERLCRVGFSKENIESNFIEICYNLNFHRALSLDKKSFAKWLDGKSLSVRQTYDYTLESLLPERNIGALKVKQWLNVWDTIDFNQPMRKKPDPFFYIFKIDIRLLKRLSEVHRRKTTVKRNEDKAIQRTHDEKRSEEIKNFVEGGFPWSTLSSTNRNSPDNDRLKMPGLLPTSLVINILGQDQRRGNRVINEEDLIMFEGDSGGISKFKLPNKIFDLEWDPELKPIEVIDGQHRLLAFDEAKAIDGNYEVPVVAFHNLDRTWQAYLFYVINIKPKKINTSLGYDLYPLLRTQEWLENSKDGLKVYKETRAQELVEALWFYDQSPWNNRINMLGFNEGGNISQAAYIRALTSSYFKKSSRRKISGLFIDVLPDKNYEEVRWVRAQQAAFLILLWEQVAFKSSESEHIWAIKLKNEKKNKIFIDSDNGRSSNKIVNDAFLSKNSMLSRDQGVTGISMFSNDFFFVAANYFSDYDFNSVEWDGEIDERQIEIHNIDKAISQFRDTSIYVLLKDFAEELMRIDWRTPSAEFDDIIQKEIQKKYKGSGGYKEVWMEILSKFTDSENLLVRKYALEIQNLTQSRLTVK